MEKRIENLAMEKYCVYLEYLGRLCYDMDSYCVFHSATKKEHVYDIYCRVEFEGVYYLRKVYTANLDFLCKDEGIRNSVDANCGDAYVIDVAYHLIKDRTYNLVPSAVNTQNKIRKELLAI